MKGGGKGNGKGLFSEKKHTQKFVHVFDMFRIQNQQIDFVINFNNESSNISTPYFTFRTSSKD